MLPHFIFLPNSRNIKAHYTFRKKKRFIVTNVTMVIFVPDPGHSARAPIGDILLHQNGMKIH